MDEDGILFADPAAFLSRYFTNDIKPGHVPNGTSRFLTNGTFFTDLTINATASRYRNNNDTASTRRIQVPGQVYTIEAYRWPSHLVWFNNSLLFPALAPYLDAQGYTTVRNVV